MCGATHTQTKNTISKLPKSPRFLCKMRKNRNIFYRVIHRTKNDHKEGFIQQNERNMPKMSFTRVS